MNSESELNPGLKKFVTDFTKLKESYEKEHELRKQLQLNAKNLENELKIVRELENSERNKLTNTRKLVVQQQDTISNLIGFKKENIRHLEKIKQQEETLADLKKQLSEEKKKWLATEEELNLKHTKELDELKLNCKVKVKEAEMNLHMQYAKMAKKLESIENEKCHEFNVTVVEYEERLHNMEEKFTATVSEYKTKLRETEEKLKATLVENNKIRERATADVLLYQRKMYSLEYQYNNALQEKRRDETRLPESASVTSSSKPGDTSRSNALHAPTQMSETQTVIKPLKPILRKTVETSYGEPFLSSPVNFLNFEETVARESSTRITSKRPKSSTSSSTYSRGSVMPQLQFVTDHPAQSNADSGTNTPLKETQSKTKFTVTKKRKLFSHNSDDML
ncbi:golgin subfamily A member 6-like protein 26 [Periplaneta americana]|uniref:golgin subfamily A member 6-like protein 26 n=1 Tax=Periplaneta americana TaxID=6978 RepID=UPI0037E7E417